MNIPKPKLLHLDKNHSILIENLQKNGFECEENYYESKKKIKNQINKYDGIILRSRFYIDKEFIKNAKNLKFIARVGSGLENIDTIFANKKKITIINSPEGNCNSVAEHAMGMLLSLMHNIIKSDRQIHQGKWLREDNIGTELSGKTIGIIGYGHTGKAFSRLLKSFKTNVLFYDILENIEDNYAKKSSWEEIFNLSDIISLHVPLTNLTKNIINNKTIKKFKKPFYLINTARGQCINIKAFINGIKSGKILGGGLDVLPYEKLSFELFLKKKSLNNFDYLCQSEKIILTPHIAGSSQESKYKLAKCILKKILFLYNKK